MSWQRLTRRARSGGGLGGAGRLACVLALTAAGLAAGARLQAAPAGPAAAGVVRVTADSRPPSTSLTLTSVGSDGQAADAPSTQAAVAANGRYVAFQSQASLHVTASVAPALTPRPGVAPPVSSIYLRDLVAGTTALLSNPAGGDATVPSISATGLLASYEQDGEVYAANRQASGSGAFKAERNLVLRRVTGTSKDLEYEHVTPCPAWPGDSQARVKPCGPRLSGDGSTLAYPAELTPVSPDLSVTATLNGATSAVSGDMLDFTPYHPGALYGQPGGTATVSYLNSSRAPVAFGHPGGITVTEPAGFIPGRPFRLRGTSCTGDLGAGRSCTVTMSFDARTCGRRYLNRGPRLLSADLVTHSASPAGQSVLELTALCYVTQTEGPLSPAVATAYTRPLSPPAGRQGCPAPPRGLALVAAPAMASDNEAAPLTDADGAEIGRPYVLWVPLQAPPGLPLGTATVVFQSANSSDCGIRLSNPARLRLADPLPSSAAPPCTRGETLTSPSGAAPAAAAPDAPPVACTAYLLVDPSAVAPDSAFLGTSFEANYVGLNIAPATYLTMQGVRHIVLARHDASGSGNFAASPSTVVSVDGSGGPLPGASQPSVSADGRYVAFAAPVPIGGRGQQVAAGATQVWRHDTDRPGNRSYQPGATTLASCLPRSRHGPCTAAANADSPSVSGDGQQVAFATTAAIAPYNGYPGGTDASRVAAGPVSPDQVYLRSVTAETTILISARAAGPGPHAASQPAGGNADSFAPVITQDSAAVGFVSLATDLVGTPVPAGTMNLYLRPAAATAADELASASGASLPAGTGVGMPSVDAHGRLATFPADSALVTGAPQETASIYTFERFPRLSFAPAAAGFGTVLIDSGTRAIPVTITDTGPGPGTVTSVRVSGPFGTAGDNCGGVTLYHGSRCSVTLRFRPAAPGTVAGELTVTTDDDGEPPASTSIGAAATVPAPKLIVSPGVASAGEVTQVRGTSFPPSQKIRLTWRPGLGTALIATSSTGGFGAAMAIFPDDFTGPRILIAASAVGRRLATAPFLAQQSPAEPPFSASGPRP